MALPRALIGCVLQRKSLLWSHRAHFLLPSSPVKIVPNSYFTNLKQFVKPEETQQSPSSTKKDRNKKKESHVTKRPWINYYPI